MNDYLSDMTEEEFGAGNEIPTTGFLVFGLLTLWIYTVWKYHTILKDHFEKRLKHFSSTLKSVSLSERNQKILNMITVKGFTIKSYPKYFSSLLYFSCLLILLLEVIAQKLVARNMITFNFFDTFTLVSSALSVFLFCVATIFFLSWACKTIRNHEYNELLFLKLSENPENFKMLQPSKKFVRRWNKNQNVIAFFLVLSFPMIISPFIAVKHIYSIIDKGGDCVYAILLWAIFIFILGGIFHLWGTKLLLIMFNGHLRIETINSPKQIPNNKLSPKSSSTVLKETQIEEPLKESGSLLPERSLEAIMLTDMVGFSREMEKDETATYSKLMEHNRIIRNCIDINRGKEIKTIGDAFLIKFRSAVDSVKAAIQIQKRISEYNREKMELDHINIRIGIHIGDILIMDGDVLGSGVNIVSRIEPLAEPGGICISADVYNIIKKSLDLKVVNIGKKELKNIKDSPEIYKILLQSIE